VRLLDCPYRPQFCYGALKVLIVGIVNPN
jgi:hypothetical protein